MNWFRTNRLGSRLALIALALHFVLSFGHVHSIAVPNPSAAAAVSANGPVAPASDHDHDTTLDPCAICAVTAMAGTALLTTPPALPLLQFAPLRHLIIAAEFREPAPPRTVFQPRAPPVA